MLRAELLVASLMALAIAPTGAAEEKYPIKTPTPGGEATLLDSEAKWLHDNFRFSAVRRMGDHIYVSGVVVSRGKDEGKDIAAFKMQTRRALDRLTLILESAGTDWKHVAMINSFHVWQGPDFDGGRDEQFLAFEEVIDDYIKPPYPAWTAVGTTGLLGTNGIVEVQLIALPRKAE